MTIRIEHLALVGQVVEHRDRQFEIEDSLSRYKGLTAYSLSKLICVHPSTAHRYLAWLEENEFVSKENNGDKDNPVYAWYPTHKALCYWNKYKHTETGKKVYAWVQLQWSRWYRTQMRKTFAKYGLYPPFKV